MTAPHHAHIPCTPANAAEMRAAVQRWPELEALIRNLQAQGLFPGLRALSITLEGNADWVAQGLAAIDFRAPSQGAASAPEGHP